MNWWFPWKNWKRTKQFRVGSFHWFYNFWNSQWRINEQIFAFVMIAGQGSIYLTITHQFFLLTRENPPTQVSSPPQRHCHSHLSSYGNGKNYGVLLNWPWTLKTQTCFENSPTIVVKKTTHVQKIKTAENISSNPHAFEFWACWDQMWLIQQFVGPSGGINTSPLQLPEWQDITGKREENNSLQ